MHNVNLQEVAVVMIEYLIVYIQTIISEYGAWGVFLATLLEEIIAPIPSPIIPLAGGFFLLPPNISFWVVALKGALVIALPVSVGISMGSAAVYALGFYGGKPAIEKTKKFTGINWQSIQKAEEKFTRGSKDEITLLILRIVPIVPGVAISGFCGVVRYPFKKFMIITSIGALIRAFILGMVGWQVGELYTHYADIVSKFEKYILLGVLSFAVLLFAGYYISKKLKARTP